MTERRGNVILRVPIPLYEALREANGRHSHPEFAGHSVFAMTIL